MKQENVPVDPALVIASTLNGPLGLVIHPVIPLSTHRRCGRVVMSSLLHKETANPVVSLVTIMFVSHVQIFLPVEQLVFSATGLIGIITVLLVFPLEVQFRCSIATARCKCLVMEIVVAPNKRKSVIRLGAVTNVCPRRGLIGVLAPFLVVPELKHARELFFRPRIVGLSIKLTVLLFTRRKIVTLAVPWIVRLVIGYSHLVPQLVELTLALQLGLAV